MRQKEKDTSKRTQPGRRIVASENGTAQDSEGSACRDANRSRKLEEHQRAEQKVPLGVFELEVVGALAHHAGRHHMSDDGSWFGDDPVAEQLCRPAPRDVFVIQEQLLVEGSNGIGSESASTDQGRPEACPEDVVGVVVLTEIGLTQAAVRRFGAAVHSVAHRVDGRCRTCPFVLSALIEQHLRSNGDNVVGSPAQTVAAEGDGIGGHVGIGIQQEHRRARRVERRDTGIDRCRKTVVRCPLDQTRRCDDVGGNRRCVVDDDNIAIEHGVPVERRDKRVKTAAHQFGRTLECHHHDTDPPRFIHTANVVAHHAGGSCAGRAAMRVPEQARVGPRPALRSFPVLRVAIDATPLIGNRTGIGQFTAGLIGALHAQPGLDTTEFAMTWRGRTSGTRPLPARPARAVWRRVDWPPIEWWTGPVDVVHGTNYVVPPTRRAAAIASVHDLTAVRYPHLCTADTLEYPGFIRRALRRGAHIHCDSRFIADELVEWSGCDPAIVHVIHPGIPTIKTQPVSPGRAAPYDGRPYLLALGTIEPRKDHVTLLRAFTAIARQNPDLLLVVAGADGWGPSYVSMLASVPEEFRARIMREAAIDDDRRDTLLVHARVLVYPSLYEGFGFPPLEAMTVGIPVVATNAGSLPEVLGDGASLVSVGDADGLAGQVLRLNDDSAARTDLIERGRHRAAAFNWEKCAGEMAGLYAAVAPAGR